MVDLNRAVADSVGVLVAVKDDCFFSSDTRVEDVLDDKIKFAARIVRCNSLDEFTGCLPVAVRGINFADVFKLSKTCACGIVQKSF